MVLQRVGHSQATITHSWFCEVRKVMVPASEYLWIFSPGTSVNALLVFVVGIVTKSVLY